MSIEEKLEQVNQLNSWKLDLSNNLKYLAECEAAGNTVEAEKVRNHIDTDHIYIEIWAHRISNPTEC